MKFEVDRLKDVFESLIMPFIHASRYLMIS